MNLNQDIVPSTIDEAVQLLFDALEPKERTVILNCSPAAVHFTVGRYLRNNWDMWTRDTPLNLDFQRRFKLFGHGDDVSGMILTSLWAKVCGTPPVAQAQEAEAERFRRHWVQLGVDPETGRLNS